MKSAIALVPNFFLAAIEVFIGWFIAKHFRTLVGAVDGFKPPELAIKIVVIGGYIILAFGGLSLLALGLLFLSLLFRW